MAVIGAGPKGIATAAKACALAAVGLDAPEVVLVDRSAIAGNWSGRQGYTNGLLPLGTPPEKDVGFPYPDSLGRRVGRGHCGDGGVQLAAASDGTRPIRRLGRREWTAYLREVAERAEAEIVDGEVVGLDVEVDGWRLAVEGGEAIRPTGSSSPAPARRSRSPASHESTHECSTAAATGCTSDLSRGKSPRVCA